MNKQERIAEARKKLQEIFSEFNRISTEYNIICDNLNFAKQSSHEIGDRVCVYEASGHHDQGSDYVGSGEVVELIRYGGWYKVKLDSGEIKTFSAEFVSKIDLSKIDMRKL